MGTSQSTYYFSAASSLLRFPHLPAMFQSSPALALALTLALAFALALALTLTLPLTHFYQAHIIR